MTQPSDATPRRNAEIVAELAKRAQVSLSTAYRWKRGAVVAHPGNARRLAAAAKRMGIAQTAAP